MEKCDKCGKIAKCSSPFTDYIYNNLCDACFKEYLESPISVKEMIKFFYNQSIHNTLINKSISKTYSKIFE